MAYYTEEQRRFTIEGLIELGKKAIIANILPGKEIVIARGEPVNCLYWEAPGPPEFVLTSEGLIYKDEEFVSTGFLGLGGGHYEDRSIKIKTREQCEEMMDRYWLGPDDIREALTKLANPYEDAS